MDSRQRCISGSLVYEKPATDHGSGNSRDFFIAVVTQVLRCLVNVVTTIY